MVAETITHDLVCQDLPTSPSPEIRMILVTGAGGYIGGRLVPELIARGYGVRVLVRDKPESYHSRWPAAEVFVSDVSDPIRMNEALEGVDVAYYLIHSLRLGSGKFEEKDIQLATIFREACSEQKVKRIIYLGGLGKPTGKLSAHLGSRIKVGETLSGGSVPVTILRAGMIIGSGSASYDILKNLVVNTPVFLIPGWAKTRSQPISIRAVILYLVGVMENNETTGRSFDIGGPEILTYDEKLKVLARLMGKKRFFLPGFILWSSFYGYIASLLTPVPRQVTRVLVDGCKNEVVCENDDIRRFVPIQLYNFRRALLKALSSDERQRVYIGRKEDILLHEDGVRRDEVLCTQKYSATYMALSTKTADAIFRSFCKIGGTDGWARGFRLWRTGNADVTELAESTVLSVNDVVGIWHVEHVELNKTLRLSTAMKKSGKVWLEFRVEEGVGFNKFLLSTCYQQKGLKGYLYWYNFLPFQHAIFKDLVKFIMNRS